MLVLTRSTGDAGILLYVAGSALPLVRIEVVEVRGSQVKLGLTADREITILRGEVSHREVR